MPFLFLCLTSIVTQNPLKPLTVERPVLTPRDPLHLLLYGLALQVLSSYRESLSGSAQEVFDLRFDHCSDRLHRSLPGITFNLSGSLGSHFSMHSYFSMCVISATCFHSLLASEPASLTLQLMTEIVLLVFRSCPPTYNHEYFSRLCILVQRLIFYIEEVCRLFLLGFLAVFHFPLFWLSSSLSPPFSLPLS